MKTGKYISLGEYKNLKIGYGTVDFKNLKTIYLKLNSWIQPKSDDDFDYQILKSRRQIKDILYNLKNDNFKKICIVDLDIKTKGIKIEKKSFMNLEVTLYVERFFDIKTKQSKVMIKDIIEKIILHGLCDENLFNFHTEKK